MQVFQRGVNESLVIGQGMVVTVLEIQPHCVRIAVRNPEADPSYYEETLFLEENEDDCSIDLFDEDCAEHDLELIGSGSGIDAW